MSSPPSKTVLITGASSGIGKSTALYLAGRGHRVVATSRDMPRLDGLMELAQTSSLSILPCQLDVNETASVEEVVPQILGQVGRLDALVNNAGYGLWGCLEDLTLEEVKAQFETNLFAVLRMSQAVLPHMRGNLGGTIVNVGSVSGRIGIPAGGAYVSSKSALDGLSRVLRMEVAQFGIRVVLIEPGLFRTNFFQNRVVGDRALDPDSPYFDYTQKIRRNSAGSQRWAGDPLKVAKTINKVVTTKRPRQHYAVGADAWLGTLASRLLPDCLLECLVKRVVAR